MRDIKRIIIHYTATYPDQDIGVEEIREWHVEGNGWRDIGYHYVVRLDGTVEKGRPVQEPGAHARNHNTDSIGVCYVGGLRPDDPHTGHDTRTPEQTAALVGLIADLRGRFGDLDLLGHRDVASTQCPGFDVASSDLAQSPPEPPEVPDPVLVPPTMPPRRMEPVERRRVEALQTRMRDSGVPDGEFRETARIIADWLEDLIADTPWYRRAVVVLRAVRDLLRALR